MISCDATGPKAPRSLRRVFSTNIAVTRGFWIAGRLSDDVRHGHCLCTLWTKRRVGERRAGRTRGVTLVTLSRTHARWRWRLSSARFDSGKRSRPGRRWSTAPGFNDPHVLPTVILCRIHFSTLRDACVTTCNRLVSP